MVLFFHVQLHLLLRIERALAHFTGKRAFARVGAQVLFIGLLQAELLAAECAGPKLL
jgi:hypothetical protein